MVMGEFTVETEVLVIGAGPGGYAAAFRAADLGLEVSMVDTGDRPGGVCLFRGCIPSKTLLYVAELMHDAERAETMGVTFGKPVVDLKRLRAWKNEVVDKLANGLVELCKRRNVQMFRGRATFESSNHVRIQDVQTGHIKFKHAILATGSRERALPGAPFRKGGRIMGSTEALALEEIPERLLIVGGGYVGVELGSVYAALGSRVTMIEGNGRLMPGADADLVAPLTKRLDGLFESIHLKTRVKGVEEREDGVAVSFESETGREDGVFDKVLVAIGREPNTRDLGLEKTRVTLTDRGFVKVDAQMRTEDPHILAVGDVVGGITLAHKAMHEGKIAAEVIAGEPSAFDFRAIPAVVYTDPQVAWCGLTEDDARASGKNIRVARFPWAASGRAVSMGVSRGLTKMIVDAETDRVLGVGIVGRDAGEMISEGVLAIEMGALAEDLAMSIHPHPTLSEAEEEAAEAFLGSSTHILPLKK